MNVGDEVFLTAGFINMRFMQPHFGKIEAIEDRWTLVCWFVSNGNCSVSDWVPTKNLKAVWM